MTMIKRLESLQQRELILLTIGTLTLLSFLIYLFIWKPLAIETVSAETRIKQLEWSLVEIKYLQNIKQNDNQKNPQEVIESNEPLVVIIDSALRKYSLYENLQRSQPIGDTSLRVELNKAKFNDLIACLGELKNSFNMNVDTVNISLAQANQAGIVNASITILRN